MLLLLGEMHHCGTLHIEMRAADREVKEAERPAVAAAGQLSPGPLASGNFAAPLSFRPAAQSAAEMLFAGENRTQNFTVGRAKQG
jgi:hypothetical protein